MKGRKPTKQNVVPLTADGLVSNNLDARARAKAKELKPRHLSAEVSKIWDRIAPTLTHPTLDRLKPEYVPLFVELCEVAARLVRLRSTLSAYAKLTEAENVERTPANYVGPETYVTQTRNGEQRKTYPEVGQLNEVLRQFAMLCDRFGMNPAAARGIANGGQGDLFENDEFFG
ncbi:MAG: P27 family phage terminase small subunit [Ancalomicrobiaceae bacterium]|nr:P27 family phage terminase small subunit [Ancalomicrobiaceae bacterium]